MDYKTIKDSLESLVTEKMSDDEIKIIANIKGELDKAEEEYNQIVEQATDYRRKYVDSCKNAIFSGEPASQEAPEPPSLEEILHKYAVKN